MTKKGITQLSYDIVGCAIKVHKELGPGLLESVYERCLKYELEKQGFFVRSQVSVPVNYDNLKLQTDFRLDLLVNECIVVELKAVEKMLPIHEAQLMTYMKLLKKPQRLLINFFTDNLTKGVKPMVNEVFTQLSDF